MYAYSYMDESIVSTKQVLIKGCGVSEDDREAMDDAYWLMGGHGFKHYSSGYFELRYHLMDYDQENYLAAPAFVDVYIVNDDGEEVYRATKFVSASDYRTIDGKLTGCMRINDSEIVPGESTYGEIHYTIYAPGYFSYKWYTSYVYGNLPEYNAGTSCKLILPTLPYTMITWTNSNQTAIEEKVNITGITYKFNETYDGDVTLYLYFNGTKTYDYKGSHNSSRCSLTFKIYDASDGTVIDSGSCLTSAVAMGESFKNQIAYVFDLPANGTYRLELLSNY